MDGSESLEKLTPEDQEVMAGLGFKQQGPTWVYVLGVQAAGKASPEVERDEAVQRAATLGYLGRLKDGVRGMAPVKLEDFDDDDAGRIGFVAGYNGRVAEELTEASLAGYVSMPLIPTEEMIQAACLAQSTEKFSSYADWWNSHSSGVSEKIRRMLVEDYLAMVGAVSGASADSAKALQGVFQLLREAERALGADTSQAEREALKHRIYDALATLGASRG